MGGDEPRGAAREGGHDERVEPQLGGCDAGGVRDGVGGIALVAVHSVLDPVAVGASRSVVVATAAIISMAPTGCAPIAVSCESITASVPSRIALATSATSARVGREAVTIESSICVAVIDGRAIVPASAISFFWTMGTSWIGSSMPRSPRATMTQSDARRIDCARSTACGFSIFAMSGRRVCRRTDSTSSARRTNDSATRSTPMSSPARSICRSPSGTDGRISVSPGMLSPWREATAPPNSTSQSNSPFSLRTSVTRSRTEPSAR